MTNTGSRPDQGTLEQRATALAARALEAVHRSNLGLRMKRALELVAVGDLTYRKGADAEDGASRALSLDERLSITAKVAGRVGQCRGSDGPSLAE